MVAMSPEMIPKLRQVITPKQSGVDALITSLTAKLDRSLMRAVTFIIEKRVLSHDSDLDSLRDSICAMLDTGLIDRPRDFFQFVQQLESSSGPGPFKLHTSDRRKLKGGKVYRRQLESGYQHYPEMLPPDPTTEKNDPIMFEHWVHKSDSAKGTVIVLHGFAMGWPVIDAVALSARQWFERGLDVVLLTLPDHGPRRDPDALFSGQSYTVPHAFSLAIAVRQAIHEIFELKCWLRSQNDRPVGLVGMSLGGYLASICAGLSDDFDFLMPLVPPACMGDLAWRVFSDTGIHKVSMDAILTEENMRAAFYIHSPLAHPRKIAKERILIAAGAGDRIVPPEHPSALWEHWGQPKIHWLRGSHMSPVTSGVLMGVLTEHLETLDIL